MKIRYTNEKNTLVLISLLKEHGIKNVIVSPGTTNVSFVASIQQDSFFNLYSAFDERSAAFMAMGLSEELREPVVLSCTGATASRNYIPGLTEAYYKNIPIIAVTSTQHLGRVGNNVAQVLDRSTPYKDLVKKSVSVSTVHSLEDEWSCVLKISEIILEAKSKRPGPVHINLVTNYSNDFSVRKLPKYRKIEIVEDFNSSDNAPKMTFGNIGIFIGAHNAFDDKTLKAIDLFCEKNNAIVLCDHTSNYNGRYKVLGSLINNQDYPFSSKSFDLLIHIGSISGEYMFLSAQNVWRVNEDGLIRDLFGKLKVVFKMSEYQFFCHYSNGEHGTNSFINECLANRKKLLEKIPALPFSNVYIAKYTAPLIPKNSIVHFGILNSLRSWNYFELDETVVCHSNTGGFGIDGCLSSMIGSALCNPSKNVFGILGDLSFFYDINSLISNCPPNLHIMVINNGIGTEFKNYNHRCFSFGNYANKYMAAEGHNGFKSESLIRDFCSCKNFSYLSLKDGDDIQSIIGQWINSKNKLIILEVFTDYYSESNAIKIMNTLIANPKGKIKRIIKNSFLGKVLLKIIRR